ncbi:MAG TPA: DNA-formamidopyrimidine glycosylase family protein [Propionibacteriaceae bacterium]
MPEGDSIWKVARTLDKALKGRRLATGELRVGSLVGAELAGVTVVENDTHGKHLLTRFDNGQTLHTHLRMDGSWTVVRPGLQLPKHLDPDIRVLLAATDGPTAYGLTIPVVELLATKDEHQAIGHLGPDPLREDWDLAQAVARIAAGPDRTIAAALLNQRGMAGLGNLWVNELCFLRGVSPWTPVSEVDVTAMVRLAVRTLRHSAKVPGAYQVTTGRNRRGEDHWVAGRAHQPCRRCRTLIRVAAEVQGDPEQRRTWWCPVCQPGPSPEV